MLLSIKKCSIHFGGLAAVSELDLELERECLVGMIGPNGAGKTTVFNLITGVYKPTAGTIEFEGKPLSGLKTPQIARLGISRTFQNIRLFKSLTVYQTVQAAAHYQAGYGFFGATIQGAKFHRHEKRIDSLIVEALDFFDLRDKMDEPALSLPYGMQRRVELVRAMICRPRLVLLDEPAAGMNQSEKNQLMSLIRRAREFYKCGILLIEHDMSVVMGICERIAVLDYGIKIAEGSPREIQNNPAVLEAYLGERIEN